MRKASPRAPADRQALRAAHADLIDTLGRGDLYRAEQQLRRMPAEYRATVALLIFAARMQVS